MNGRERILQVAPLLWGRGWKAELCDELGVHPRTLRRYLSPSRKHPIDPKVLEGLETALEARLKALEAASEEPNER